MNGVFIPSAIARVSVLVWPSPPPPLHLSRPLGVLWSRSEADGLQTRRSIQLSPFASLGNLLFPQSSRLFVPRRLRSAPHHRSASLSANRREPGQRWRAPRDAGPVASPLVSSKIILSVKTVYVRDWVNASLEELFDFSILLIWILRRGISKDLTLFFFIKLFLFFYRFYRIL